MSSFQIPTPCHENWDKMTPVEQGRHCQKCVKTVHDVTNWSDEKILSSYHRNNKSLCIRIPEERLAKPERGLGKWKYYVAAGLASFLLTIKKNLGLAQSQDSSNVQKDTTSRAEKIQQVKVTGVVHDSLNTSNPIVGADVVVYKDSNVVTSTYTNHEGEFQLDIKDEFKTGDSLVLSIHYMGMNSVTRKFEVRDSIDTEVLMTEGHICLKETVVMRRRSIMQGTIYQGVLWRPNSKSRQIYKILDDYDTKHIHHEELQRLNLRH
jgi:hypothetical protein